MKTINIKSLAIIGGSLFAAANLQANLVLNGDFEGGIQPTDPVHATSSPWTRNPDQSVIIGVGIGNNGTSGAAFAPGFVSDLLTQTLTTQVGQTYAITFWLKDPGTDNQFLVLWGGTTILTLGSPVQTTGGGFEEFTETATATSASTLLGFEALPGILSVAGTYAPVLDDVDVEQQTLSSKIESPVPEPSTILSGALLMLPLGLSAIQSLRKNRDA